MVAADASSAYRSEFPGANGATRAASIAAEEDVDLTASWWDVPKSA
jgi:hypothetical protein